MSSGAPGSYPREVRRALVYVLQNGRKHGRVAAAALDPFSSATFFEAPPPTR